MRLKFTLQVFCPLFWNSEKFFFLVCFDCQRDVFGHVRSEDPTYLKSKGKTMNTLLCEDKSNSSSDMRIPQKKNK